MPALRTRDTSSPPTLTIISPTPRAFIFPSSHSLSDSLSDPPFEVDLSASSPASSSGALRNDGSLGLTNTLTPKSTAFRPRKGDDYVKLPENKMALIYRKWCWREALSSSSSSAPSSGVSGLSFAGSPSLALGKIQRQADNTRTISKWKEISPEEHSKWADRAREIGRRWDEVSPKWDALAEKKKREQDLLHRPQLLAKNRQSPAARAAPSSGATPPRGPHSRSAGASLSRRRQDRTPVDTFLSNHEQRVSLLAQAQSLTDLRTMLTACEERISASLIAVLDSRDAKRAALLLEGARAQSFLDAVQDVLDRGALNATYASQARRLIIRLSEAREQLPSSLFITGVSDHDECPTFSGGFGDVYRASVNGGTVALKRIRKFHASAGASRSRLQVCREALIWQKLRHKNVLPLIGIDRETFPSFSMVSPWMKHGNVLKYLNTHGRRDVESLLLQIAEGLAYLHSMDIVHGDLRGTNILVADDWSIRLADFGLASAVGDDAGTTFTAHASSANHAGSLRWFAPELILPKLFECERFVRTPASDVYAFACVCVELHTGKPPFSGVSPDVAAMLKVVAGERPARPATMSERLWGITTAAWAQKYLDRPGVKEIVEYITTTAESDDLQTSA